MTRSLASRGTSGAPGTPPAGATLIELVAVLAIVAVTLALAVPKYHSAADRAAVQSAVRDAAGVFGNARRLATARGTFVAVAIDTGAGSLTIHAGTARLGFLSLAAAYGVRVGGTRDSMAYDPRGVGYGAADLSVIIRRGQATETLFVARLGRVRYQP